MWCLRGGSSIFARGILKVLDITDRYVWVVDSFQGLPKARTANDNDHWSQEEYLKVSLEEVQTNSRAFNLLDDQVHFCIGYFVDSLPLCKVSQIAVLRMDVLAGGVIIVDDFNIGVCVKAINDFRSWHSMTEEIKTIPDDRSGSYWIKKNLVTVQLNKYKSLLGSAKLSQ